MKTLKELVESLGIKENSDEIVSELDKLVETKLAEVRDEYDIKIAKKAEEMQEAAEKAAAKELEETSEMLEKWHENVIEEKLQAVDNQLKIASEVRNVRSGMEKMIEGLQEAGILTSQIFENIAASEVVSLQDEIDALKESLEEQKLLNQKVTRGFIVSECTRGMADIDRDLVINRADKIDESIDSKRFESLVKVLIAEAKSEKKKDDDKEKEEDKKDNKEKESVEEATNYSMGSFVGKQEEADENFLRDIFSRP